MILAAEGMLRERIMVRGIVQGVGFRPFVHALAARHSLLGWVGNNSSGVFIEVQGDDAAIASFRRDLLNSPPPLAVIESITADSIPVRMEDAFVILESERQPGLSTPVSPDIAVCDDCLREFNDPHDRRYRYPFINCTNCGPRFTIIRDLPYDRANTTMADFRMCELCAAEYHLPSSRRFHAQPNACPQCGPHASYLEPGKPVRECEAAIQAGIEALGDGKIVAIKGIGGFHLAVNATDDAAVNRLRDRKRRPSKPLALMARDIEVVRRHARVSLAEEMLLTSRQRPILLLERSSDPAPLSGAVAPGNDRLGFMLPYAPLHYLLLTETPLVMTSGNLSDEPIAWRDDDARERLSSIADAFLIHNRPIHVPCDDSVILACEGRELPIRRSRGYSPMPVNLAAKGPSVLAAGAELKATLCITKDEHAYLSQHIGDMENLETLQAFELARAHLSTLFRAQPAAIACDLHPGYLSSRWARSYASEHALALMEVQHHHAHIASLLAEHSGEADHTVIGVAFDGTGYGLDGAIWGGEVLIANTASFERAFHLKYVPLPGGDAAIRNPYRIALAHLWAAGVPWDPNLPCVQAARSPAERNIIRRQLETGLNTVPTSSMGRLFDAVSALIGLRQMADYEAQAAIELEALTAEEPQGEPYGWAPGETGEFDAAFLICRIVHDLNAGVSQSEIAARFLQAVADAIVQAALLLRERKQLNTVALSGGVFQNLKLLRLARTFLEKQGFEVLIHRKVPPNDGGIALGQAVIARNAKVF